MKSMRYKLNTGTGKRMAFTLIAASALALAGVPAAGASGIKIPQDVHTKPFNTGPNGGPGTSYTPSTHVRRSDVKTKAWRFRATGEQASAGASKSSTSGVKFQTHRHLKPIDTGRNESNSASSNASSGSASQSGSNGGAQNRSSEG